MAHSVVTIYQKDFLVTDGAIGRYLEIALSQQAGCHNKTQIDLFTFLRECYRIHEEHSVPGLRDLNLDTWLISEQRRKEFLSLMEGIRVGAKLKHEHKNVVSLIENILATLKT